ncbi:serine/threonine protein kinase [Acanthopleuribacter pedis]|uniref:Protein kinase n=1 Tax=Acanthopleuribacter pedis TaxID=442870 RepID=A0A8J7QH96_9BACT|nr:serine/threonine-protein kinase [Acanthopleuribacter pedis]MBO1320150.1 protein kinase [Acanthopleuribacter pedis]
MIDNENPPNRRLTERIVLKMDIQCHINGRPYRAQTIDFGPKGLSILSTSEMPLANQFRITMMPRADLEIVIHVEARNRKPVALKNKRFTKHGLRILSLAPSDIDLEKELRDALDRAHTDNIKSLEDLEDVSVTQTLPPWLSLDETLNQVLVPSRSLDETVIQENGPPPTYILDDSADSIEELEGTLNISGNFNAFPIPMPGVESNRDTPRPGDPESPPLDHSMDMTYADGLDSLAETTAVQEATPVDEEIETRSDKRLTKRVQLQLDCHAMIGQLMFQGATVDFSAKGLSAVFTSDIPIIDQFRLKCRENQLMEFDLKVQEKHREQVWTESGYQTRIGLKILKYSPNFETFLSRHRIFKPRSELSDVDRALAAGLKLELGNDNRRSQRRAYVQIPVLAKAGEKTHRCRSIEFGAKGLSILAPMEFPKLERFPIKCFGQQKLTFDLRVEEKSRAEVHTPFGKLWRIGLGIISANEGFDQFLVKIDMFNRGDLPNHNEVIDQALAAGYDGEDPLNDRRSQNRLRVKLPILVKVAETVFRGRSQDFGPKGLCFYAPINFPANRYYLIKCQLPDRSVFSLKVTEKNRRTISREEGDFYRIGVRILGASKEFKQFLQDRGLAVAPIAPESLDYDLEEIETSAPPTIGKKGRYHFIRKVGEGSFAEIYLVQDRKKNIEAAMKVLKPKYARKQRVRDQFIHEAQIVSKFRHPNIAQEFDTGEIEEEEYSAYLDFPPAVLKDHPQRMVYYTMQFIKGWSLDRVLKTKGRFDQIRTLEILRDVAGALKYAHNHDVVHLDIKPKNIMLHENGQVLITDFGLARILDYDSHGEDTQQPSVKLKNLTGTPYYMAPEQAGGGRIVDFRADLYSMGVTAFQMVTGKRPFTGNNWYDVVTKHLKEPPPTLRELEASVNPNFEYFVLKCLKKNPDNRFESASEVLHSIEDLMRYLQADMAPNSGDTKAGLVQKLMDQFGRAFMAVKLDQTPILELRGLHLYFMRYFETWDRLDLTVTAIGLMHDGTLVYQEDQGPKSFSFHFYEDGIRNITFYRGLLLNDLKAFMEGIVAFLNGSKVNGIDAVTLMFQLDLGRIRADYVDTVYEDDFSRDRLRELEEQLRYTDTWDENRFIEGDAIPFTELESLYLDIEEKFSQIKPRKIREQLGRDADPIMRREAIDICLRHIQDGPAGPLGHTQARLVDALIRNCVSDNDFDMAVSILHHLDKWRSEGELVRSGVTDPRIQLASPEFFRMINHKQERELNQFESELKQICRWCNAEQTVTELFHLFVEEEEPFHKKFLAKLCLHAAREDEALKLVDWAVNLSDAAAAMFLPCFSELPEDVDSKIFLRWLNHPGTKTRLALIDLISQRDFPERRSILQNCAQEEDDAYHASRKAAWHALEIIAPQAQEETLKVFYEVRKFARLTEPEKEKVFELAERTKSWDGQEFLIQVLTAKGAEAEGITLVHQKHAAYLLKQEGSPAGMNALKKAAGKFQIGGNKELIRYCKLLLEK